MKYEYKVIVVRSDYSDRSPTDENMKVLNKFLADEWEVFMATPENVATGSSSCVVWGAIFFTIRKEIPKLNELL